MKESDHLPRTAQLLAGAVVTTTAIALVILANRGLDLTDEGFYLNWISDPYAWDMSTTQFGFIYHPLYVLLGNDIVLLRRSTILVTLGLSWVATYLALGPASREWSRAVVLSATTGIAGVGLTIYNRWLLTPSYHTLVLHSGLLVVIGMLLLWSGGPATPRPCRSQKQTWRLDRTSAGALLLGVGGAALFVARPPSGAAAAVVIAVTLVAGGRLTKRSIPIVAVSAAGSLIVLAVAVDGSLVEFVRRLTVGAREASLMEAGHSLSDLWSLDGLGLDRPTLAYGSRGIHDCRRLDLALRPRIRPMVQTDFDPAGISGDRVDVSGLFAASRGGG